MRYLLLLLGIIGAGVAVYLASRTQGQVAAQTECPECALSIKRSTALYQNEKRIQINRDEEGRISELVIHTTVHG